MTILKYIPQSVNLDYIQNKLCQHLEQLALVLKEQSWLDKIKSNFIANNTIGGIYLHGSVGRGKTMLMKAFYDRIIIRKELVHYQNFMLEIHKKIHNLQPHSADKVVADLADSIAKRTKVLCIDEFEIKDITDAMMIMRLFDYLYIKGVFIFLTTNTLPDDLYKDGLQRELFLPFITMVKEKFEVLYLDSQIDYRFKKLSGLSDRIIYPLNPQNDLKFSELKQDLTNRQPYSQKTIEVFGRKLYFAKTYKETLFVSFSELIEVDFGYADYVSICQEFKVIVLENVPIIQESETDKIIRFINFIDNAYFYKVLLFASLEVAPENIYQKGRKIDEFKRTVSRLNEMDSIDYLNAGLSC